MNFWFHAFLTPKKPSEVMSEAWKTNLYFSPTFLYANVLFIGLFLELRSFIFFSSRFAIYWRQES
jgi:hypothetical protein